MTQEPKACPFCGANDGFHERADFSSDYFVCNNCLARGPLVEAEDAYSHVDGDELMNAKALAAWNTRASDNVVAELVEAAQRIIDGGYVSRNIDEERPDYEALVSALAKLEASK